MSITFSLNDGKSLHPILPTTVSKDALDALLSTLDQISRNLDRCPYDWTYGDPRYAYEEDESHAFSVEVRICPLPLATIARIFGHDIAMIQLADEAQFNRRRLTFHAPDISGTVYVRISEMPDAIDELNVANGNAYQLLETLRLPVESCGSVTLRQLREAVSDARNNGSLHRNKLQRYIPFLEAFANFDGDPDKSRIEWA